MRMRICRIAFAFFRKMRKSQCEFTSLVWTKTRRSKLKHGSNHKLNLTSCFVLLTDWFYFMRLNLRLSKLISCCVKPSKVAFRRWLVASWTIFSTCEWRHNASVSEFVATLESDLEVIRIVEWIKADFTVVVWVRIVEAFILFSYLLLTRRVCFDFFHIPLFVFALSLFRR